MSVWVSRVLRVHTRPHTPLTHEGSRGAAIKPSLVHTWSNVLSWTKVPKDLLIKQIPTLEVGLSRLETLSRSLTLAVTLALGSARERFTAPAPAGTSWGRP